RDERADDRAALRRDLESQPAALLRPDAEQPAVADAVQDRRLGAAALRCPGELLVPDPARLSVRDAGALCRGRHLGAERSAVGAVAGQPERTGHRLADYSDDALHHLSGEFGVG